MSELSEKEDNLKELLRLWLTTNNQISNTEAQIEAGINEN